MMTLTSVKPIEIAIGWEGDPCERCEDALCYYQEFWCRPCQAKCKHEEAEYTKCEPENNIAESYKCGQCGLDLDLPERYEE